MELAESEQRMPRLCLLLRQNLDAQDSANRTQCHFVKGLILFKENLYSGSLGT